MDHPRFDLTTATEAWLDALRQRGTLTDDDLRELQTHLLDSLELLKTTGLSEEEACIVACNRLGSAEAIGHEFSKIQRPFALRREPILSLVGALAFVVLKNGLDAVGFGVSRWLVAHVADDRAAVLADFGIRFLLFTVLAGALAAYFRRGERLHQHLFAWLHRAPAGVALALTTLVGAVQFFQFSGEKSVARALRDLPIRDLYGIRLNERLFVYGVYMAWLVAFALMAVRQRYGGKSPLLDWFRQAQAVPLLLLGWLTFFGFFVGPGFEVVQRLTNVPNTFIAPAASLLFCLTAGSLLAKNWRYALAVRFALVIAPVLIWCAIDFVENPADTLNFLIGNGSAAVVGAALGLGLGTLRRQRNAVMR